MTPSVPFQQLNCRMFCEIPALQFRKTSSFVRAEKLYLGEGPGIVGELIDDVEIVESRRIDDERCQSPSEIDEEKHEEADQDTKERDSSLRASVAGGGGGGRLGKQRRGKGHGRRRVGAWPRRFRPPPRSNGHFFAFEHYNQFTVIKIIIIFTISINQTNLSHWKPFAACRGLESEGFRHSVIIQRATRSGGKRGKLEGELKWTVTEGRK